MRTRPRPQKSCACTFAGRRKHGQSLTTWSCMESPGFESCAPPTLTEVCKCTPWGGFRGQQCRSDAVHAPDGATGMCAGDTGGAGGAGNVGARAGCTRQERVVFAGRRCAYELLEVCGAGRRTHQPSLPQPFRRVPRPKAFAGLVQTRRGCMLVVARQSRLRQSR